jgi:hypothetical protein
MATKAERFKAEQQRAARLDHGKRKTGAVQRKQDPTPRASHNAAPRAGRNSVYELEPSPDAKRPSRKSSRKSATHIKTDSALRIAVMNKTTSPKARAERG